MSYDEFGAIHTAFNGILEANRMGKPMPTLSSLTIGEREDQLQRLVDGLVVILEEHEGKMPATSLLKDAMAKYRVMEDDGARAVSRLVSSGKARFTRRSEVELSGTRSD